MTITMNDSHLGSITEIREFLKVSSTLSFTGVSRKEQYAWTEKVLVRFRYGSLRKKEKSVVKAYIMKMTGRSDAQITRMIGRYRSYGRVFVKRKKRNTFPTKYTPGDIALLAQTDNAHSRLSGPATRRIMEREYGVFGKKEYARMSSISVSHIYNLREKRQYRSASLTYTKTHPVKVPIGERKKPLPCAAPGYIRVDTVHQGDKKKEKGVYHINMVDEVLQWEVVAATEKISERYLLPVLEDALSQFPFRIVNFHSDNGSEYINTVVAKLLNKLLIRQTKSRSRHCNDNALVEGKNGSVIRKHIGRIYIAQRHARPINRFYRKWFNGYLNYHRPCAFSDRIIDRKGKEKKVYRIYMTPFEKLCSLSERVSYLKAGVSLASLWAFSREMSDTEYAEVMQKEKRKMFQSFKKDFSAPRHLGLTC